MIHKSVKYCLSVCMCLGMVGCASVKIPNIDFIKFPEFKQEAQNIGGYPDVADAPQRPTQLRSNQEWDAAAKTIIHERDSFTTPPVYDSYASDEEILSKIEDLSSKVDAYKADDPSDMKP